jgi:hypothetical protein
MSLAISECCITGHLHDGTPKGAVVEIAGVNTYVTGKPENKDKTLLFISDIFGYNLLASLRRYKI